jgi:hypothetical protein
MTTPLTPEEEADMRRRDSEWDAAFTGADWRASDLLDDRRRLLATLDRERRERVDPDLRARISEWRYDAQWRAANGDRAALGEVRAFDKVLAILAATEAPQIEGHYPGCSGVEGECACAGRTVKPATPDHTVVGEERGIDVERLADAMRAVHAPTGLLTDFDAVAASYVEEYHRATPRPR